MTAYETTGHSQHAIEVQSDPKEKIHAQSESKSFVNPRSGTILAAASLIVIALITVIVILSQDPKRSPGPAPAPGAAPKNNPPAKFGVIGLKNLGNTCYMNSVVQALVQIPQLEEVCDNIPDDASALAKGTCSYIAQYKKQVSANDNAIMIPQALYDAKCVGGPNGEQHDSSECIGSILDALIDIEGAPDDYTARVRQLFVGSLSSTITRHPGTQDAVVGEPRVDAVTILTLPIHGNLQDSLRAYTATENVDMGDGQCSVDPAGLVPSNTRDLCECEANDGEWEVEFAEKKVVITAGDVLVIALTRFETTFVDGKSVSKKINDAVAYPSDLDLTEYAQNYVEGAVSDPAAQYELFATVRHHGKSMGGGHYTAVVKPPIPEPFSQWFIANDSLVEEHKSPLNHSKEAYLLFYKRKQ